MKINGLPIWIPWRATAGEGASGVTGTGGEASADAGGAPSADAGGGQTGETGSEAWNAALPAELRDHMTLKGVTGVEDLATKYVNQAKVIGDQNRIVIPGADATPEQRDAFYAALGRPESADKYDLGDFKPNDNLGWDDTFQASMLGILHQAGLTNDQVQKAVTAYHEWAVGAVGAFDAEQAKGPEKAEAELRTLWAGDYDTKMAELNRGINAVWGDEADAVRELTLADGLKVSQHPLLARGLQAIGAMTTEDGDLPDSDVNQTDDLATAEAAAAALDKFRNDPEDVGHESHRGQPGHKERKAHIDQLILKAGDLAGPPDPNVEH